MFFFALPPADWPEPYRAWAARSGLLNSNPLTGPSLASDANMASGFADMSAALSAVGKAITDFVKANFTAPVISQVLADYIRNERQNLIQARQASKNYITYVDGRRNNREEDIKPGGTITYKFSYVADAVEFALQFLRMRVPRVSGLLSDSFYVMIGDVYVAPGLPVDYASIPPDATVAIGNTAAYWRKADTNLSGTRSLHYPNPNILNDCVAAIQRKYGDSVSAVRVRNHTFPGIYQRHRFGSAFQSPAIILAMPQ